MPTPNSNVSTIDSFGKRWRLQIKTLPDGQQNQKIITIESQTWTPEPLEIEFEVYTTLDKAYAFAEISIFNLNQPTEQIVLKQGMTVRLEAGYMTGPGYGVIFDGILFQPTWERIDGIDTKLTLHCMIGLQENSFNFVSMNVAAGIRQRELIARMAAAPNIAYPLDTSNVKLNKVGDIVQTRGAVYFDQPLELLAPIAIQDDSHVWFSNLAANVRQLVDQEEVPTLNISQQTGLIGTPQQTQDGVDVRINLDSRAVLRGQIQLSPDTQISQLPRAVSINQQGVAQANYPTILDAQGKYAIAAIRHIGNSRGNIWETIITGITFIGTRVGLLPPY